MVRWFDSLYLCLALAPIAIYMLTIGYLNLRRRTTVVSGFADTLLLGLAISGLVIVGPVQLFFPEMAAFKMGAWVWPLLVGLYALLVLLLALSQRPRVVFYNAQLSEILPLVDTTAQEIDPHAGRVRGCFVLPEHELQLHVSQSPLFRNVQVESLGEEHNLVAWSAVRRRLVSLGRDTRSAPNVTGYALVGLAAISLAILVYLSVTDHHQMAQAFGELLRRE